MMIDDLAKVKPLPRRTALSVLIVIAGVAAYNWMVAPHTTSLFATMNYEDTLADVAEEKERLVLAIATQQKNLESVEGQFADLKTSLFTTKSAEKFFSDLQAIAREENCALYSLDFQTDGRKSKGARKVADTLAHTAELGVIGDYANIVTLLERLQKRTQKVWLELEMEAVDDNTTEVKCLITITIYLLPSNDRTLS